MSLLRAFVFFALPGLVYAGGAVEVRFELNAPAMKLVADERAFLPFANRVRAEVERLMGVPEAIDDMATLKLLLSTRVHLAHHFADDATALATAAWIRSLQTDDAARAFAGLTTLASVEARRMRPGAEPGDPEYRAAFFSAFTKRLAGLPKSPAIASMLRGQHEKFSAITREALIRETREVIVPALERRGFCGLEEADQIVRVRHRIESIVPVREETLRALNGAIRERTLP